MTFIYELDPYSLEIHRMSENHFLVKPFESYRLTDKQRQTRPKLYTTPDKTLQTYLLTLLHTYLLTYLQVLDFTMLTGTRKYDTGRYYKLATDNDENDDNE